MDHPWVSFIINVAKFSNTILLQRFVTAEGFSGTLDRQSLSDFTLQLALKFSRIELT